MVENKKEVNLSLKIVLKSVRGKVGNIIKILPCKNPETSEYADCVKRVDSNGDMILSKAERNAPNRIHFVKETDTFDIVDGTTFDLENVRQRFIWEAIQHCPLIAPDYYAKDKQGNSLINGNLGWNSKNPRFGVADLYVERPGVEANRRVSRKKIKHDAESYIYGDDRGYDGRVLKARLLGHRMEGMADADVTDYLLQVAERDHWRNYKWFEIGEDGITLNFIGDKDEVLLELKKRNSKVILLEITPELSLKEKIFTNLVLISNKAEPESFHFEIEGDNYEFSSDKRNMYFRLEATKELYLNMGSDILYNRLYTDVSTSKYSQELYYRKKDMDYSKLDRVYPIYEEGLVQQTKSTIFPLYYERIDTYNDIYHKYQLMKDSDGVCDFLNLSGSEISWNRDLNQFNIITHIKNSPINLVGRLRGNSYYKEGKWNILIPSIIFNLKNEKDWPNEKNLNNEILHIPPIVINSVPNDFNADTIELEYLPNIYKSLENLNEYIETSEWTSRKEVRIRDKWMKVRIRYSGKNLAIIHSLVILYNISYKVIVDYGII